MASSIVIVESPAKAKTIEKYLWTGYTVTASMWHIADLPSGNKAVDKENNYTPQYEISKGKKKVVQWLKKLVKSAKEVILATDEDREGEAIARHICRELGLDPTTTQRIVFHEITKEAIQKAIKKPRSVDMHLVNAQQARRVLDRLVGFDLSPVLRKKIKPGLSAGRVQSVAVKLIVEREKEREAFASTPKYDIQAEFMTRADVALAARGKTKITIADDIIPYMEKCRDDTFVVTDRKQQPWTRNPAVPFTTSTLQQEASRKLGYAPKRTMQLAQRLYEAWLITYMRTDSINLSAQARRNVGDYIVKTFGSNYHKSRVYKTKSKAAQEAHEAIRPTNVHQAHAGGDDQQKKLYHLIRQRTMASQMAPAKLEKTTIALASQEHGLPFEASGNVVTFDGFLRVYGGLQGEEVELPAVRVGEEVSLHQLTVQEWRTKPPARYTEAMLIKKMEELGIGRPSTYAPTISTIEDRGYVFKDQRPWQPVELLLVTLKNNRITSKKQKKMLGAGSGRLAPSDVGILVTEFLQTHFDDIMDYSFTAQVEKEFDEIADGNMIWYEMIDGFYQPFQKKVSDVEEHADRVSGERILGDDPVSWKVVKVRMWRFGPLVQIGDQDDPDKKFASLKGYSSLKNITLEEALEACKLPRVLGTRQEKELKTNIGRFGPYVQWWSTFASLPKDADVMTITYEEALPILEEKLQKDLQNTVGTFLIADKEAIVKKWRRGYFVTYKRKKHALPKGIDVATIDTSYVTAFLTEKWALSTKKRTTKKTTKTRKSTTKSTKSSKSPKSKKTAKKTTK